tara:strand:+ start:490 stop:705 length:216 start_codon:yes stop_codon:yes gene_type:complete
MTNDYSVSAVGGVMVTDNRSLWEMVKLAQSLSAGDGLLVSHEEKDELIENLRAWVIRSGPIMEQEIPRKAD